MANPTSTAKQSWLDGNQTPMIDHYTQQLTTFLAAMADGRIDSQELADQENRLVAVLKEVEPTLSEAQHAQVTKLLCELTAYNIMQSLHMMQTARPQSVFQG